MIEGRAISSGLRASLISALIMVESGGRRYAWRPEPRYHYLWDIRRGSPFRPLTRFESASESPPADFPAPRGTSSTAEWWGQQASWGLMQIMGAVAREQGLQGPDLPVLCDPAINLGIGVPFLAYLIMRFGETEGISAYNAGPGGRHREVGMAYASKVLDLEQELLT